MATLTRGALGIVVTMVLMAGTEPVLAGTSSSACCLGEPHGIVQADSGMGLALPPAEDVSQDVRWSAYKFERSGVNYIQVNDRRGNVRVMIGNIDELFWSLPAGVDAGRVSTPQNPLRIPAKARRTVVYGNGFMVLAAYEAVGGTIWSIEAADGAR